MKTYDDFLYENYNNGDLVLILFKIEGTDKRELIPVKIIKRQNGNNYLVSFNVEGNPIPNHDDISIKSSKIISSYSQIKEPLNPSWTKIQPVPTDYNKAGDMGAGGVTNDYVLPNS